MRKLNFYEFTGVIVPGVVILMAAGFLWPGFLEEAKKLDLSLGSLGVLLILAYIVGHLIQAVGNLLEECFWYLNGGWPSDWPRTKKRHILSDTQLDRLQTCVRTNLDMGTFVMDSNLTAKDWMSIFRQIYATVRAAGRDDRVYTFNGNYGMFRGIAAASLTSLVVVLLVRGWEVWPLALLLVAVFLLALARMYRFGVHYARETLVQFLNLPPKGGTKP